MRKWVNLPAERQVLKKFPDGVVEFGLIAFWSLIFWPETGFGWRPVNNPFAVFFDEGLETMPLIEHPLLCWSRFFYSMIAF